jgi:hypothetical protein
MVSKRTIDKPQTQKPAHMFLGDLQVAVVFPSHVAGPAPGRGDVGQDVGN